MKYDILHRSSGRLRIHIRDFKPDERKAADLTVYFESMENVKKAVEAAL